MKALAVILVLLAASPARAGDARPATFALIIGVNRSVDRDVETLRFADDDAAQYFELFRSLGARTYLLTELDSGDRALYPQAAAEAVPPTRRELDTAVARLAGELERAHRASIATVLYVIYAGHGNVGDDGGYVSLADARLTGRDIARAIVDRIAADQTHLIVDACYSYLLTLGRGPGGERRPLHGFADLRENFDERRVGLLLSTSSARTSHEWQGVSAGIFSYEVRAGLQGAADADHDHRVSYREIGAFVARANAAIANPAYRPDVYARPPRDDATLVDIRWVDRIGLDRPAHYLIEDDRGVRIAELHSAAGQDVELVRRRDLATLYVRDLDAGDEIVVDPGDPGGAIGERPRRPVQLAARGPADALFGALFALPFDRRAVDDYRFPAPAELATVAEPTHDSRARRVLGWLSVGGAGVLGAAAGASAWSAHALRRDITADTPQAAVVELNAQIRARNRLTVGLAGATAAAALTGVVLLAWPARDRTVIVVPTPGGIAFASRF